jgi:hypothetical protein
VEENNKENSQKILTQTAKESFRIKNKWCEKGFENVE